MKKLLEEFNSRFEMAEERIREVEDRSIEIIQIEEQKENKYEQKYIDSETCGTPSSIPIYA